MPIEKINRADIRNDQIVDSVMTRVIPRLNELIELVNHLEAETGLHSSALKAVDTSRRFGVDFSKENPHEEMDTLVTEAIDLGDEVQMTSDPENQPHQFAAGEPVEEETPESPEPVEEDDVMPMFDGLSARKRNALQIIVLRDNLTHDDIMARTEAEWRVPSVFSLTSAETIWHHLHPEAPKA